MPDCVENNLKFQEIKTIRKYLKLKILEDNVSFRNHDKERVYVYDLVKRTFIHGESHSALLIGPPGCGKTTLINSVLSQISQEVDVVKDAIIVKLNGLIHHEEKVALKSITIQMQLENAVGDRVFGTFAENLSFLLSCLQSGADRRCKSMVFILEEFDIFCHSGRTQTLLYNLFDITHSRQAPVCVLGVTCRMDVMELLEKRVKSRFSHQHIFLFPTENDCSNENGQDYYTQILVELLSVPVLKEVKKINKSKGRRQTEQQTPIATLPDQVLRRCKADQLNLDPKLAVYWNDHVMTLVDEERVVDALEKLSFLTRNEQVLRNILFQLVSKLSPTKPFLQATDLISIIDDTQSTDQKVKLLQSLSILELSLVIAMKHGMDIFDGQPMNFEMVLHRYTKFANANSSAQTVPRPVILKAFEHLQALEIIMPVRATDSYNIGDTTASRVQKEYKLYTLAVHNEDINEAVKHFKSLPTEISHWYNNSIV